MALTSDSIVGTVRRKARRAHENVMAAEGQLVAANEALKDAVPRHDVAAITEAAERTIVAEEEVRNAAQELEVVNELLESSPPGPAGGEGGPCGASGEGARSLLPLLKGRRRG
jgi:hypothetical protein